MSSLWHLQRPQALAGRGARELLDLDLTAFFASRQCPGSAIRAATDWALQQARAKRTVISGFHSPLEQPGINRVNDGRQPGRGGAGPPRAGRQAVARVERLVGTWTYGGGKRRREERSPDAAVGHRTQCSGGTVGAHSIVVAHARPAGSLAAQMVQWQEEGRRVDQLVAP